MQASQIRGRLCVGEAFEHMVRVHLKFQHNPLGGVVVFSSKHDCSTSCQCGCSFAGCWDKSFEHLGMKDATMFPTEEEIKVGNGSRQSGEMSF